uniref:Uncharacterized protein n=1 Tax=Florenciella sp. virus SA2 TaxID=3240092 RepID=A0AB39J7E0_9VIRU
MSNNTSLVPEKTEPNSSSKTNDEGSNSSPNTNDDSKVLEKIRILIEEILKKKQQDNGSDVDKQMQALINLQLMTLSKQLFPSEPNVTSNNSEKSKQEDNNITIEQLKDQIEALQNKVNSGNKDNSENNTEQKKNTSNTVKNLKSDLLNGEVLLVLKTGKNIDPMEEEENEQIEDDLKKFGFELHSYPTKNTKRRHKLWRRKFDDLSSVKKALNCENLDIKSRSRLRKIGNTFKKGAKILNPFARGRGGGLGSAIRSRATRKMLK